MSIKEKYNQIDLAKRQKLGEVIRFGIVGAVATILQYVIYLAAMPLLVSLIPSLSGDDHTLATVSNTLAYIISFIFNFIASTRYTFKVKANAKRGAGFTLLPADSEPSSVLPQPLRRFGIDEANRHDSYPLHLHPRQLPACQILPQEIIF